MLKLRKKKDGILYIYIFAEKFKDKKQTVNGVKLDVIHKNALSPEEMDFINKKYS